MTRHVRPGELTRRAQVVAGSRALVSATRHAPGAVRGPGATGPAGLAAVPDSALCRAATEQAVEELTPAVLRHSLRCWQWGSSLAHLDGTRPDPEALYVACVLHDITLGTADPEVGCFAHAGSEVAAVVCHRHGRVDLAPVVREAVAHHFDPRPVDEPVARALHAAVNLDVVGHRSAEIARDLALAVLAEHPRDGFRQEFLAAVRLESRRRPRSMAAAMHRAGMALPMRLNALDRLVPARAPAPPALEAADPTLQD